VSIRSIILLTEAKNRQHDRKQLGFCVFTTDPIFLTIIF